MADEGSSGSHHALERDVVLEVARLAARRRTAAATACHRRRCLLIHAARGAGLATAAAAAVEHGERAAEARDDHLRRVALLAALVGPFARRELALDIDLGALLHVLLRDFRKLLVEDHHAVPFGALLALAALAIAPRFRRGPRHVHHVPAILHGPHFGVAAEITDQDDLVHAARHGGLLRFPGAAGGGTYLTGRKLLPLDCGQPPILGCAARGQRKARNYWIASAGAVA